VNYHHQAFTLPIRADDAAAATIVNQLSLTEQTDKPQLMEGQIKITQGVVQTCGFVD